jgi:hypothetical protein
MTSVPDLVDGAGRYGNETTMTCLLRRIGAIRPAAKTGAADPKER